MTGAGLLAEPGAVAVGRWSGASATGVRTPVPAMLKGTGRARTHPD
jgi:hypothetical protein